MGKYCPVRRGLPVFAAASALALLSACAHTGGQTRVTNISGYACGNAGLERFNELQFDAGGKVLCKGKACASMQRAARTIDGRGSTLWPGLIDAHAHLLGLGQARQQLDLTGAASPAVVKKKLASWALAHPDDDWIVGRGWNQMQWPDKKFPDAGDIDAVVADRPVVLERVDGHAIWVNSAALKVAGVDARTVAPAGGEILRDASGLPTGILVDNAESLVKALMPKPGISDNMRAYLIAVREANANGLTGVHEAGASYEQLQALQNLAENGQLSLRVNVMLSDSDDNLDRQGPPQSGLFEDRLDVRSVKIYADGALGSRGAALLAPYSDRAETSGLLFLDQAALTARIKNANDRGYQAAVHAIGDRANHVTLNAFADVQGDAPSVLRNRIEHAQILAPADIQRFAELGVIASMQPVHATSDMWMAEERLNSERLAGAYAWQTLRDAGAQLAFGSDFPVEPVNPFFGLHAAVTRRDRHGEPPGGWRPNERLSLEIALCGFTRDAAFAARQEDIVGSLRPGQWADFILLEQDPFAIPVDDLWRVKVAETWLAGQRVYAGADKQ